MSQGQGIGPTNQTPPAHVDAIDAALEKYRTPRTLASVAAELENAQKVAATVKPLRDELDRLLGKRTRAKKGAGQ